MSFVAMTPSFPAPAQPAPAAPAAQLWYAPGSAAYMPAEMQAAAAYSLPLAGYAYPAYPASYPAPTSYAAYPSPAYAPLIQYVQAAAPSLPPPYAEQPLQTEAARPEADSNKHSRPAQEQSADHRDGDRERDRYRDALLQGRLRLYDAEREEGYVDLEDGRGAAYFRKSKVSFRGDLQNLVEGLRVGVRLSGVDHYRSTLPYVRLLCAPDGGPLDLHSGARPRERGYVRDERLEDDEEGALRCGTVLWFRENDRYGFIRGPDASKSNVFFHEKDLRDPAFRPRAGDEVQYVVRRSPRGRWKASEVRLRCSSPAPAHTPIAPAETPSAPAETPSAPADTPSAPAEPLASPTPEAARASWDPRKARAHESREALGEAPVSA